MRISDTLAEIYENITPQRLDMGPPLPYFLQVRWPSTWVNKMPKVVSDLSRSYSNLRGSLGRGIRNIPF